MGEHDGGPFVDDPPWFRTVTAPNVEDRDGFAEHDDGAARELRLDDIGNAERFYRAHGHQVRYVPLWDRWLVWRPRRGVWVEDHRAVRVLELAKRVADDLWHQVARTDDEAARKALIAHAKASGREPRLRAAVSLTRGMPNIAVEPHDLDCDPYLLNVANGTLDLRTGTLRPHDPADLLTKRARAAYRPDVDTSVWEAFLARVQPDAEMRAYLRRLIGYALSGRVTEHVLPINHGDGQNGKTTFREAVAWALGDYAGTARTDLLVESRFAKHDAGRVALEGRRFVAASETGHGGALSESEVKDLTGGDTISMRRLHGQQYEVIPTWLLWLSTNHRPTVRGTDLGIWRRLRLIEWPVTIPEHERDDSLPARLHVEADGILAWAIEGLRDYQAHGLADPDQVRIATTRYRDDEDTVGRFLAESSLTIDLDDPRLTIPTTALGDLLDGWSHDTGERLTQKALGTELKRRGAIPERNSNGRYWRHLGRHDAS